MESRRRWKRAKVRQVSQDQVAGWLRGTVGRKEGEPFWMDKRKLGNPGKGGGRRSRQLREMGMDGGKEESRGWEGVVTGKKVV
jgi:hypothetical protein